MVLCDLGVVKAGQGEKLKQVQVKEERGDEVFEGR